MSNKNKKKVLFDEPEEEEEVKDNNNNNLKGIAINQKYADRYDTWRSKEELQKLKDKYGDADEESDESTDESEDEDAKELTNDVEIEFFKALSFVKSKDSKIYDKEKCKFFENMSSSHQQEINQTKSEPKEKKPFLMKDLEREMILKKMKKAENGEENIYDEDEKPVIKTNKPGYYEEQDAIKNSIKAVIGDSENEASDQEEDAGLLKVKVKSNEEKEKEEQEHIEWLKGRRDKVNPEIEKNMKYLHDYWNDPKLNESERYLRDYLLNKRYLDKDDDEDENSDSDQEPVKNSKLEMKKELIQQQQPLDYVDLSEEEKIVENQEEFERKYNFRFEDPDPEFIKSYPRTVADSMRRKKIKRKEKREEYKKRKELEKLKKKEEIKRMKSLKRKEIEDKIEKLKKTTGINDLKLSVEDLDKDFDPDEYEKQIESNLFNDDYYQVNTVNNDDNEDDKPVFTDDEEEDLKYQDWDEWKVDKKEQETKKKSKKRKKNESEEEEAVDFEMDCENLDTKSSKKQTKLAKALLRKKPLFNENEKTFEEYFDEYYKLDCEDIIGGDIPCRFKYREVVPNDFGLSMDEIIGSKDNELNQWASLKKVTQYRSTTEEINDLKLYKNKKTQIDAKKKILASLYNEEEEEEENEDEQEDKEVEEVKEVAEEEEEEEPKLDVKVSTNKKKEEKSSKKKHQHKPKKNKNILESITDERLLAYGIQPKKFHKKIKYSK